MMEQLASFQVTGNHHVIWHIADGSGRSLSVHSTWTHYPVWNTEYKTVNTFLYTDVYYSGIKIFNHLQTTIKNLLNDKNKFQIALRKFLLHNSFYSLEEYFNTK